MDIAALIASFSTGTYSVTRTTCSTMVRGRAQAGNASTVTITASVSPASGSDLVKLPEGRRTNETKTIFTSTKLFLGGQGDAYEADSIAIGGEDYELMHVETWTDPESSGIGYRCLAVASR